MGSSVNLLLCALILATSEAVALERTLEPQTPCAALSSLNRPSNERLSSDQFKTEYYRLSDVDLYHALFYGSELGSWPGGLKPEHHEYNAKRFVQLVDDLRDLKVDPAKETWLILRAFRLAKTDENSAASVDDAFLRWYESMTPQQRKSFREDSLMNILDTHLKSLLSNSQSLKRLGFSPTEILRLMKIAPFNYFTYALRTLKRSGELSEPQMLEAIRLAAKGSDIEDADAVKRFIVALQDDATAEIAQAAQFKWEDLIKKVLKLSQAKNGDIRSPVLFSKDLTYQDLMSRLRVSYFDLDERHLTGIMEEIFRTKLLTEKEQLELFEAKLSQLGVDEYGYPDDAIVKKFPKSVQALVFVHAPERYLPAHVQGADSLRTELISASSAGRTPLSSDEVTLLLSECHQTQQIHQMLRAWSRLRRSGLNVFKPGDVISTATGIDLSSLEHLKAGSREAAEFTHIALDLSEKAGRPIFSNLNISPDLLKGRNLNKLIQVMERLRTHSLLKAASVESANAFAIPRMMRDLTPDRLDLIAKSLDKKIHTQLQRTFPKLGTEFPIERLMDLKKRWGDLKSIYTLISRFSSTDGWREELGPLGLVMKHSAEGTFHQLKYETEEAKWQLRALPEGPQREAWKKEYSRVGLWTSQDQGNPVDRKAEDAAARDIVQARFSHHIGKLPPVPKMAIDRLRTKTVEFRGSSKELLDELRSSLSGANKDEQIVSALSAALKNAGGIEEASAIAQRLYDFEQRAERFDRPLGQGAREALEDLIRRGKAIKRSLSNNPKESDAIVASVTFSDPKMLLTIGQLVSDYSCQDYQSGDHIQTLLGYVIDANVKGMYGSVFGPSDFKSQEDFAAVKKAILDGRNVRAEVNGADLSFNFEWTEGNQKRKVRTQDQERGYRRHVLKLGTTDDGKAGLHRESGYRSTTGAESLLEAQSKGLVDDIAKATGAQTDVPITVEESQNPGGQYSDSAGGVQLGPYRIPSLPR